MTPHEDPPLVDLDDILDEVDADDARVTRTQWLLVLVGGIASIAGLLALLVATAPALLDLVGWINSVQKAVNP